MIFLCYVSFCLCLPLASSTPPVTCRRRYTIPLDKRLAADGRGLQEVTINNKFAMLSESLYVAERKAAEDLRVRNQIRKKMAMREKEVRGGAVGWG